MDHVFRAKRYNLGQIHTSYLSQGKPLSLGRCYIAKKGKTLPPSHFYWINLNCKPEETEWLSHCLFEKACDGLEEIEKGSQVLIKASFLKEENWEAAKIAFASHIGFSAGQSENEDWDLSWRLQQNPIDVTPWLRVTPPWIVSEAPDNGQLLRLEAKMAFGTGSHESTRLCLQLMKSQKSKSNLGTKVLDVGTGTGILSLHARFLGCYTVGLDIDVAAATCLSENNQLNKPSNKSEEEIGGPAFYIGTLDSLKPRPAFDCIICNMIRSEVVPLREQILKLLDSKGILMVSGQLVVDKPIMLQWLAEVDFALIDEVTENEWWAFTATSKVI